MRITVEALMYVAFSAAALPLAWLGVSDVLYYRAHPEMFQYSDSAPSVFAVVGAVQLMKLGLGLAAILALYFFVRGPRAVRYSSCALVIAWSLTLASVL